MFKKSLTKERSIIRNFTLSASLFYVMTTKPKHGHLENTQAKRYVRRRFTQKDIDDGSLVYIVDDQADHYSDSFGFRVEDSRANTLDNQL